jgi:hypothetical protein
VNVNDNRKIDFKISSERSEVKLQIWGDAPNGNVRFNLPAFKNNIASADAGTIDNETGVVTLTSSTTSVTVKLQKPVSEA